MGQLPPGAMTLVQNAAEARAVAAAPIRHRLAFITQTTLSVDDTAEIVAILRAPLPGDRGAASGRTSATPPPTARRR